MKKFLLLFGIVMSLIVVRPVSADVGICNKTCQVNEECGQGYRCYVGVCRATACPSSQTCGCAPTPAPTPATQVLKATPTPLPKATPVASPSGTVKSAPKTGGSLPEMMMIATSLICVGLLMRGVAVES